MRTVSLLFLMLATSACFATRNDVRILQGDIFALKAEQARADSARAAQLTSISATLNTTLTVLKDSVDDVATRLTAFQGATRHELYLMQQQLLRLEELLGQSSAALSRFRSDIEARNQELMQQAVSAATPPPVTGDTTTRPAGTTPPVVGDGPNVLYEVGRDLLLQRSYSSARGAFEEVLSKFPDSDRAPHAQLGIAEAFGAEQMAAQEDSTYRVVFTKYPVSEAAARAMYKLALLLDRQQKRAEARSFMQRITREYPRSDEYALATDWIKNNP